MVELTEALESQKGGAERPLEARAGATLDNRAKPNLKTSQGDVGFLLNCSTGNLRIMVPGKMFCNPNFI